MALQVNWTDQQGDTHENCYFIVSDVKLQKKFIDTPDPVVEISSDSEPAPDWVTTAGNHIIITLCGWISKADRDSGKVPRFVCSVNPTDWATHFGYHEYTTMGTLRKMVDVSSPLIDQAYAHVMTLDQFSSGVQV